MRLLAKCLALFLTITWMNLPIAMAEPWFKAPKAPTPIPVLPSGAATQINNASVAQSIFIQTIADLKQAEAAAFDAMVAEVPYRLRSQYLYNAFLDRLLLTGFLDEIKDAPSKVTQRTGVRPDVAPLGIKHSNAPKGLLTQLGLPSAAYNDSLLMLLAEKLDQAGAELKVFTDKRTVAEKKVSTLLASLVSQAKTDYEKTQALGLDAAVTIRRSANWPMHTVIPELNNDPECSGDLFKDQALFSQLNNLLADKRSSIVQGYADVLKVLRCDDQVQTVALDGGITLAWIRLHEKFGGAPYDVARSRVREWLFTLALMVGDANQTLGMSGAQTLVLLAGDTRLASKDSWIVKYGLFFFNGSAGSLDQFAVRSEAYVPAPAPALGNKALFVGSAPPISQVSDQLKSAMTKPVALAQKPLPATKAPSIDLSKVKPFEYLDLTTPYGLTFRELQESCKPHDPIAPLGKSYSIMDFITISAPDRVGMGVCSKAEMLAKGGYCKDIVCDNPEAFDTPPPIDDGGTISSSVQRCSLFSSAKSMCPTLLPPMPSSGTATNGMGESKVSALAVHNDGCATNPWMEGDTPPPPPPNNPPPDKPAPDTPSDGDKKSSDKGDERPSAVPADATDWQCDADGCSWDSPSQGLGCCISVGGGWGCGGNGNGQPGGTGGSGTGAGVAGGTGSGSSGGGTGSKPGGKPGGAGGPSGGNAGGTGGSAGSNPPASIPGGPSGSGSGSNSGAAAGTGTGSSGGGDGGGNANNPWNPDMQGIGLPGEGVKKTTDANATGGGTPETKGVVGKFFDKLSSKIGPKLMAALTRAALKSTKSKNKFPSFSGDMGPSWQSMKAFNDVQYELIANQDEEDMIKFAVLAVDNLKTPEDVSKAIATLARISEAIKMYGLGKIKDEKIPNLNYLVPYYNTLKDQLQKSDVYKKYVQDAIDRTRTVMSNPQFRQVAQNALMRARAGSGNSAGLKPAVDAAYDKMLAHMEKNTQFSLQFAPHFYDNLSCTHFDCGSFNSEVGKAIIHLYGASQQAVVHDLILGEGLGEKGAEKIVAHVLLHRQMDVVSSYLDKMGYVEDVGSPDVWIVVATQLNLAVELAYTQERVGGDYSLLDEFVNSRSGAMGTSRNSGSRNAGGRAPQKDCPPDAISCGGAMCQPLSNKVSMEAKCGSLIAIKDTVGPISKPVPTEGGGKLPNDPMLNYLECMFPTGNPKTNPACFNVDCGNPANSASECCNQRKGGASAEGIDMTKQFLSQCGAIVCSENSNHPCCAAKRARGGGAQFQKGVSTPSTQTPRALPAAPAIDPRKYVPYKR